MGFHTQKRNGHENGRCQQRSIQDETNKDPKPERRKAEKADPNAQKTFPQYVSNAYKGNNKDYKNFLQIKCHEFNRMVLNEVGTELKNETDPDILHRYTLYDDPVLDNLEFIQRYIEEWIEDPTIMRDELRQNMFINLLRDPWYKQHVAEFCEYLSEVRFRKEEEFCKFSQIYCVKYYNTEIDPFDRDGAYGIPDFSYPSIAVNDEIYFDYPGFWGMILDDDLQAVQTVVLSKAEEFDFKRTWEGGDGEELTYLDFAAYFGSTKVFKYFVCNDVPMSEYLPIAAICGGDYEIVHLVDDMMTKAGKTDEEIYLNMKCLNAAVMYHREALFDWIFNSFKYNPQFQFPFTAAIDSFNFYIFKRAFFHVTPNIHLLRGIINGIEARNTGIVRFYFNAFRGWVDYFNYRTPKRVFNLLIHAIHNGSVPMINLVMKEIGFNPIHVDVNNRTLMHYALEAENLLMFKVIIDCCPEHLNTVSDHGETPLYEALRRGFFKYAGELMCRGADVFIANHKGKTMLHAAALGKIGDHMMESLVLKGLDPDQKDDKGYTFATIVTKNRHFLTHSTMEVERMKQLYDRFCKKDDLDE